MVLCQINDSYFDLLHAPAQPVGDKTGDTASHNEIGTTDLVPLSCFFKYFIHLL